MRKILRESEANLRCRRAHGDAVPADATLAGLVRVMRRGWRRRVIGGEGVGGLTRDVPGERGDENECDGGSGNEQDEGAAEAASAHEAIRLDAGDHRHVQHR